jgi:hypothetical protein
MRIAMSSTQTRDRDPEDLSTGVFYIGLGDQFDDDRRLVRVSGARSAGTSSIAARVAASTGRAGTLEAF